MSTDPWTNYLRVNASLIKLGKVYEQHAENKCNDVIRLRKCL